MCCLRELILEIYVNCKNQFNWDNKIVFISTSTKIAGQDSNLDGLNWNDLPFYYTNIHSTKNIKHLIYSYNNFLLILVSVLI